MYFVQWGYPASYVIIYWSGMSSKDFGPTKTPTRMSQEVRINGWQPQYTLPKTNGWIPKMMVWKR